MTDPTPTDWRALCAELLEALENAIRVVYHEDGTKHISTADPTIAKADAALAQPEPQVPTDEELMALAVAVFEDPFSTDKDYARAILARWGTPAIEPVPVAERLPTVDEAKDGIWWFSASNPDGEQTHWLPHHALPVPQQEAE